MKHLPQWDHAETTVFEAPRLVGGGGGGAVGFVVGMKDVDAGKQMATDLLLCVWKKTKVYVENLRC